MPPQTEYPKLHERFVALTGRPLTLTSSRWFVWEAWSAKGFTAQDLETVVRYILGKIKKHERRQESLRFERMIMDSEHFEEDLAEANAALQYSCKVNNERHEPNKDAVLKATGRVPAQSERTTTPAAIVGKKTVAELVAAMRQSL